jgi:hypothetical protein
VGFKAPPTNPGAPKRPPETEGRSAGAVVIDLLEEVKR